MQVFSLSPYLIRIRKAREASRLIDARSAEFEAACQRRNIALRGAAAPLALA